MNEIYPKKGEILKAIIGFFSCKAKRKEILKHPNLVGEKPSIVIAELLDRDRVKEAAFYANSLESEDGLRMKLLNFVLLWSLRKKNNGHALLTALLIKKSLGNQLKDNDPDLERKLLEFNLLWFLENCYINAATEIVIKLNRDFTREELKTLYLSMKKLDFKQINDLHESHEVPPLTEIATLFSVFLKDGNG